MPRLHGGDLLATGRPRTSRRSCTRRRAATPRTCRRCWVSPARPRRSASSIVAPVSVTGLRDRRRRGDRRRDRPGNDRLRAGGRRGRPVGPRLLAHAGPARRRRREGPRRHVYERPMWTYWCLRRGRSASTHVPHRQRRRHAAGDPRRHRRAADRRRGRVARDRGAVGHLLQARLQLRRRAGRGDALGGGAAGRRRGRRSVRAASAREYVVGDGLRADVDVGARALPQALRGQTCRCTTRRRPAASARSPPTASRCSTSSTRTPT